MLYEKRDLRNAIQREIRCTRALANYVMSVVGSKELLAIPSLEEDCRDAIWNLAEECCKGTEYEEELRILRNPIGEDDGQVESRSSEEGVNTGGGEEGENPKPVNQEGDSPSDG